MRRIEVRRTRVVSLPLSQVISIAKHTIWAMDLKIVDDYGNWIRSISTGKTKVFVEFEFEVSGSDTKVTISVSARDQTPSYSTQKWTACENYMKRTFASFMHILDDDALVSDSSQRISFEKSSPRIIEKETIREVILVICPFCGTKNAQGTQFCEKCGGNL